MPYFFAGNLELKITSAGYEIENPKEAVLVKSNVDLLSDEFKGNAVNLVLREMVSSENFEGFNKISDDTQNIIPIELMDDTSDIHYGIGNACSDDVIAYFVFEQKITSELADGVMTIRPHVIEISI